MCLIIVFMLFFCFKQKTAYEMRISDWSSDVCSSDLPKTRTIYGPRDSVDGVLHDHVPKRRPVDGARLRLVHLEFYVRQWPVRPCVQAGMQLGRASCRERVRRYV